MKPISLGHERLVFYKATKKALHVFTVSEYDDETACDA